MKSIEKTKSAFLEPLSLKGGKSLPDRILPAPMEGILSPLFTKALAKQGHVKAWITPFYRVGVGNPPRMKKLQREIQFFLDTGMPVVVQLMGTDPELISLVAERFVSIEGVTGINFNFACPSKRVNHSGGGGACLQTPDLMCKILKETESRCKGVSISAKIRSGFNDPNQSLDILPRLRDSGCEWVTVHHRTVKEAYSKVENRLPRLEKAKEAWGELPFLASGDVFGVEDVLELEQSGFCDGVVIARGLIRKPLLLGEARKALLHPERKHDGDLHQRAQAYDFMESILKTSTEDLDTFWSHKYCMELARNLFGLKDPAFRCLTHFTQNDGPIPLLEEIKRQRTAEIQSQEDKHVAL